MIRRRLLASTIFTLIILSLMIAACSSGPPPIRLWFNEGLMLDEHDYPPGVDFVVTRGESSECLEYFDSIEIANESSTPVYLKTKSFRNESGEDYVPCPEKDLCLKVVSNQAWEWEITNFGEGPPREFGWIKLNYYREPNNLVLGTIYKGLSPSGSRYYLELFESQNVGGYGGDRPEDVLIPESQYFELPYVYGGEEFNVGVTLSYSLNECYPKKSTYNPRIPYSEITICYAAVVIIGIAIFILVVFSIVKGIENRAKNRANEEK